MAAKMLGLQSIKIMELLWLGKIDKGSVSAQIKYIYLSSRWFISKPMEGGESKDKKVQAINYVHNERDSLITIK